MSYDNESRLTKGRESVLACKTKRELLQAVMALEDKAFQRGYRAAERKYQADAMRDADNIA